ncbi:MAG TPA: hypothetical protein VLH84_00815 [Patescibacteria group bacterium]|nr:hypothetical protein [Patescibacteria group bacterium]
MNKLQELGYSDSDFGPNRTFITARAAETAVAAGVMQLRAVKPEIALVRDFVDAHVTNPDYRFPADIDELSFVFRWSGEGNKLKWRMPMLGERGWDTKLHTAPLSARFLNAWHISQAGVDQLRSGDVPPDSATLGEMDPLKTVEISVADWENPRLTQQFVGGVLFNMARRRERTTAENLRRDVFEAFDGESLSRFGLVDMAADLIGGRPFDDIMPLAAITRGE